MIPLGHWLPVASLCAQSQLALGVLCCSLLQGTPGSGIRLLWSPAAVQSPAKAIRVQLPGLGLPGISTGLKDEK